MTGIGEALGTAAEGGLFARAISKQGKPGREGEGHFHETVCLNCNTQLLGPHCHECGQPAHLHRTLGALWHDIAHGVLHMEGKTWRTLPMLAWKPGELTRRYVHGERAKFVSPMALFLFSVFLMFGVFQAVGIGPPTDITTGEGVQHSMEELRLEALERRDSVRDELRTMPKDDPDRQETEKELREIDEALEGFAIAKDSIANASPYAPNNFKTGVPFLDHGIEKWNRNPGLMLYKLQSNSYKFSWLLIPLSLPFVWLLFVWKRGVKVYDHAIFITYSLAFMSLLFVVLSLLGAAGVSATILATAGTMIPLYHIYRHLRGAYGLRRLSTVWRLLVLLVFITVILTLFLNILLLLGAV
ncbi:DUF3667 domain-containing protein [Qipengyuania sp.]|uniref:DUF3667 domain-containing protein n=1 Tax=Qipengyuania sp. TaxID=2004515 RepID=UPI0035C838BA